ncbi:hypothetical protein FAI41_04050 [Acetobacteraceae bacterium]|nr:hypothetical protein FAI41_04050 [Acetobacteraceae bacterium]
MVSKITLILPNYRQSHALSYQVKVDNGQWSEGTASDVPSLPQGCGRGMSSQMFRTYGAQTVLGQAVRRTGENVFLLTTPAGEDIEGRTVFLTAFLKTDEPIQNLSGLLEGAEIGLENNLQLLEAIERLNQLGTAQEKREIAEMLVNFQRQKQGTWFASKAFLGVPEDFSPDNGQKGGVDIRPLDRKMLWIVAGITLVVVGGLALHACQTKKKSISMTAHPVKDNSSKLDQQVFNNPIGKMEQTAPYFQDLSESDLT